MTGTDGYLTASYRYNAYGEMTFGKPQYENVYGYNGESYNPNLNGQYLRARYYNVGNANFFTEDSYLGDSREPLSLNRYNYAHSNPENYRDPSGQFVLTLSSLAITAGVGAITGVIFSVLDQYTTEGKIEAGRTIKAAFYGATWAVIGVGAGAVVGTALTGIGMGATFSSTVMMGAVDGMITGTAVRANTELLDHAFANFERDRAKLSGTVLDEVPKKTWQESVSRILDPKSTATDAIAGGIAGGLFYMANAAMLKNQVQQCAEEEIAKNANWKNTATDTIEDYYRNLRVKYHADPNSEHIIGTTG